LNLVVLIVWSLALDTDVLSAGTYLTIRDCRPAFLIP
jgi:hypothetical protein